MSSNRGMTEPIVCKEEVGGGNVIVWVIFSAAGVGPLIQQHGRVNANIYQNLM